MREVVRSPIDAAAPASFSLLRVPFFLEPDYPRDEEFEETNRTRLHRKWGSEAGFLKQVRRRISPSSSISLVITMTRRIKSPPRDGDASAVCHSSSGLPSLSFSFSFSFSVSFSVSVSVSVSVSFTFSFSFSFSFSFLFSFSFSFSFSHSHSHVILTTLTLESQLPSVALTAQKKSHTLKERGRAAGIKHFDLDRIASSTFAAHRMVQHVTKTRGTDAAETLYADLNERHFEGGAKLNDRELLVACAARVGVGEDEARSFLAGDEVRDAEKSFLTSHLYFFERTRTRTRPESPLVTRLGECCVLQSVGGLEMACVV